MIAEGVAREMLQETGRAVRMTVRRRGGLMRLGNLGSIRLGAAALVLATFSAGAAQTNIVTNPGFETGDLTGWTLSGDTSFTRVDIDLFHHSGSFSAFLSTCDFDDPFCDGSTGSITQTLATTAGASYDIEFWLVSEKPRIS